MALHLTPYCGECCQSMGYLDEDSHGMLGLNHPMMCMVPYHISYLNFWYTQLILNNLWHIWVLQLHSLELWQFINEDQWTVKRQQVLQLSWSLDLIVGNICLSDHMPILEDSHLSILYYEENVQICGLRSHRYKEFFVIIKYCPI